MKDLPKEKSKVNLYLRFSSVGLQMGGTIAFFTWLGNFLDDKQANETPIWTIVLSLLGVAGSLYLVVRAVKNIDS